MYAFLSALSLSLSLYSYIYIYIYISYIYICIHTCLSLCIFLYSSSSLLIPPSDDKEEEGDLSLSLPSLSPSSSSSPSPTLPLYRKTLTSASPTRSHPKISDHMYPNPCNHNISRNGQFSRNEKVCRVLDILQFSKSPCGPSNSSACKKPHQKVKHARQDWQISPLNLIFMTLLLIIKEPWRTPLRCLAKKASHLRVCSSSGAMPQTKPDFVRHS